MISDILRAFDNGQDPTLMRYTLDQPTADRLSALFGDYTTNKKSGAQDLQTYLAKFLSDNAGATDRTNQETGAIDQFYNGGMSTKLFNLRAATKAARDAATEQSIQGAQRNINSSRINSGGGGASSYDQLLNARTRASIAVPGALQDVQDERGDLNYLTNAQLGLTGQRQRLTDTDTGRLLVPSQMRRQELTNNSNSLGTLEQMALANTKYGFKQNRTGLGKAADVLGSLEKTANDVASAYSSFGGMGGGGWTGGLQDMVSSGTTGGGGKSSSSGGL